MSISLFLNSGPPFFLMIVAGEGVELSINILCNISLLPLVCSPNWNGERELSEDPHFCKNVICYFFFQCISGIDITPVDIIVAIIIIIPLLLLQSNSSSSSHQLFNCKDEEAFSLFDPSIAGRSRRTFIHQNPEEIN